jgi:hypothetical protein
MNVTGLSVEVDSRIHEKDSGPGTDGNRILPPLHSLCVASLDVFLPDQNDLFWNSGIELHPV